jgi:hypothetical protein
MASKRGERRRACGNKVKHSQAGAFSEAIRLRRLYPGEQIDAYRCKHCSAWHVGHRVKKVRQAIQARRREERRTA